MKSKKILFLSNGYGEDKIATAIIEKLLKDIPELTIKALPLVGEGNFYLEKGIEVILSSKMLPSGGFALRAGFFSFLKDIKAGWLRITKNQIKILKKEREEVDLVISVGDIWPVILSLLFIRKTLIFLPTAKSDYIQKHHFIERFLMKKFCKLVITRDSQTASSLRNSGIKAIYVGNIMLDSLEITGEDFGIEKDSYVIGILPGSKNEAYENLKIILKAVSLIKERLTSQGIRVEFLLSFAPSLELKKLRNILNGEEDWIIERSSPGEKERGIIGHLTHRRTFIKIIQGKFGDILKCSRVIIGLSGTGNEQAVGMGKPVITFWGKGPQITRKFISTQQKILGEAISVVKNEEEEIARETISFLTNTQKLQRVREIGQQRMGKPGGVTKMVNLVKQILNSERKIAS
ncbi:lipid-A-disaccharide synthase-related protein [Candidatus Aerophobetes bacterium]|nr:lipid-A-disaccharide synthase-related protein [Candidatus Aerophobetes bacterium]